VPNISNDDYLVIKAYFVVLAWLDAHLELLDSKKRKFFYIFFTSLKICPLNAFALSKLATSEAFPWNFYLYIVAGKIGRLSGNRNRTVHGALY